MLELILIILLVILLLGALPVYPYSRRWGYFPGGLLTLILVVFIVLLLIGAIDFSGNANT
jgi:hypothetical protein